MPSMQPSPTAQAAIQQNSQAILHFLQQYPPFNRMEMGHLLMMIEQAWLRFYAKGTQITSPDDEAEQYWFLIRQGMVQGVRPNPKYPDNTERFVLTVGDSFPVAAILSQRSTRTTYVAHEDCFCLVLSATDFVKLLRASEPLRTYAIGGISTLFDELQQQAQARASAHLGADYSIHDSLASLIVRKPISCSAELPLQRVLQIMQQHQIGSMVVVDEENRPSGIFTLRDLRRVLADDPQNLYVPIGELMITDPLTLPPEASAFDAALLMAQHHIGHVCLIDEDQLVGVVSERDLFSLQRVDLVHLARALRHAKSIKALQQLRTDIHHLVDSMLAHGADANQITQVITQLNDHTTSRIIELVLRQQGDPGIPFNWLVFGSEARGEQALVTDQDNGILFLADTPEQAEQHRQKLLPIAQAINTALDQCGLSLCKGNIMAGNPKLCLSLEEWQARFDEIMSNPDPKRLLQASVFFDLRMVWGEDLGFKKLHRQILNQVQQRNRFLRQLAKAALNYPPAPSQLRRWIAKTVGSSSGAQLDLKRHGLGPFVDAARVLALSAKITQASTQERLDQLAAKGIISAKDAELWSDAYRYLQLLRLQLHQRQESAGEPLTNTLRLDQLNQLHRRMLREAMHQVRYIQTLLNYRYRL